MNLRELRAKKETYMNTMRGILNGAENRSLTAAEQKDFDGLKAKAEEINSTLERASQLGEMRAEIERPITSRVDGGSDGGMIYGRNRRSGDEVRALARNEAISDQPYNGPGLGTYVRGLVTGRWNGADELRDLAEGGTPGSYLVPTPLATYAIDLVRNQARVIEAGAYTVGMESNTLKIARLTADVTAGWKSENAALTFSDANFDAVTFNAQMLVAGSKLSIEVVEDAINVDAIVTNSITKALALELDRVSLYGTGVAPQPKGIKSQTNVTITDLGSTAGYTLVDFSKYSAAIATLLGYNFPGPFSILHSARTAGELDALQDTLHQPLRQPDLVAAARKLVTNQIPNNLTHGSASTASDAFVGQFDQCMIGMRTGLVLEVSRAAADATNSAFANGQVWIRAYLRADVGLAHPKAFNVLTGIL
jgi:HK97 family phage major capsid protein